MIQQKVELKWNKLTIRCKERTLLGIKNLNHVNESKWMPILNVYSWIELENYTYYYTSWDTLPKIYIINNILWFNYGSIPDYYI